jgi:hypothetical protein
VSELVEWIAADSSGHEATEGELIRSEGVGPQADQHDRIKVSEQDASRRELPMHNFPARTAVAEGATERGLNDDWDRDPDLWMYRKKTAGLLQRYMRWSLEAGRVPSLLGRELFRARITAYTATTFEARVIFLHDVETCLDRLGSFDREIIARVVLQEHNNRQAARMLHCTARTIERRLQEVLDDLSEAFLKAQLMIPMPDMKGTREKAQ